MSKRKFRNVTVYMPLEVAEKMNEYKWVNWSEVCRRAVIEHIEKLDSVEWGSEA